MNFSVRYCIIIINCVPVEDNMSKKSRRKKKAARAESLRINNPNEKAVVESNMSNISDNTASAEIIESKIQTSNEIFSLDIGTRTVVGVLGHVEDDKFCVDDAVSVPHKNRAMTDGQIEDIGEVARIAGIVKSQLEERNHITLNEVSIAAAGRALKTKRITSEADIEDKGHISDEIIKALEMDAIDKAQSQLDSESNGAGLHFYCVGHTVIKYFLDDYPIKSLVGHKGKKASAEIIAAFLPDAVVESLYSVMDMCGLTVRSLTLEPIAAMNVIIPPEIRLINIALVDIGAGTSDIAISRDGSIVAYAMATVAGDEITEDIIKRYLVDFTTAEEMKQSSGEKIKFSNILGMEQEIDTGEFFKSLYPAVDMLAETIADNITAANGEAPAAVFLVGGGSQIPELAKYVAEKLAIPAERVAVGGQKFMKNVSLGNVPVSGPEFVTPIGIGVTATLQRGYDFSVIELNGEKIRVFDTKKITVADILRIAGYKPNQIIGRSGRNLTYMLNGERQNLTGKLAEPSEITVNGAPAAIDTPVKQGDTVKFREAVNGVSAEINISDIAGDVSEHKLTIDGMEYSFGTIARANGKQVSGNYNIQNYDDITISSVETLGDLMMSLPYDTSQMIFMKNGRRLHFDYFLEPDDELITCDKSAEHMNDNINSLARQAAEKSEIRQTERSAAAEKIPEDKAEDKPTEEEMLKAGAPITVILNGRPTLLEQRSSPHEFLELMAIADIDMKDPPAGKDMITTINGNHASFLDPLKEGDVCVVRWED